MCYNCRRKQKKNQSQKKHNTHSLKESGTRVGREFDEM